MSDVISGEILFFLISVSTGILILFGYDLLRAFRRVFVHGNLWLAIEDFLYWSIAGIVAFAVIFINNSGMLRGFSIIAMLLGMMLYHKSISRFIIGAISGILKLIVSIIRGIFNVLTFPFRFISKKMRNRTFKMLKNRLKRVKMTLKKK